MIQFDLKCHAQEKKCTNTMHDCSSNKYVVLDGLIPIIGSNKCVVLDGLILINSSNKCVVLDGLITIIIIGIQIVGCN